MSNYLNAIKIYQWIFAICFLSPPPVLTSWHLRPRIWTIIFFIYSLFSLVLLAGVITYSYLYYDILKQNGVIFTTDTLSKVLGYTSTISSGLVYAITLIQIFTKYGKYKDILRTIEEMENDIKTENITWQTLHWKIFRDCGCGLIVIVSLLLFANYNLLPHEMDFSNKIIILLFSISMQLKCIEYGLYVKVATVFLEQLLETLENLKKDIEIFTSHGIALPWPLLWQVIKNQMLVNRIWHLVKKMEKYFGWPIMLLFYYNTIAVLTVVNWVYVLGASDENPMSAYYRLSFIACLLGNLLYLCYFTEKCVEKYRCFGSLIHSFYFAFEDRILLMRVREYSLQLQHQKLLFTCYGYWDINLSSFGKMLLAITAYIVVLIEFQLQETNTESLLGSSSMFGRS